MARMLLSEKELQAYDEWLRHHPEGSFWQSREYLKYMESLGRETRLYARYKDGKIMCCALVVIDKTFGGLSTWEIPRGPIGEEREDLMEEIVNDAKEARAMALYISPIRALPLDRELVAEREPHHLGLKPSGRYVHCEATLVVDLTKPDEEMLEAMKPKGRYNIRLAIKHNVDAEVSDDIEGFIELMKQTSNRDAFGALPPEHYRSFFKNIEESFLLMSYHPDHPAKPIGGLLGVFWNDRGIYYYGASDHAYRALMAPYRLQWAAMNYCEERGAKTYDLLGIAPPDASEDHPWHGITAFKEKLGGALLTYPPEQVLVLRKLPYRMLQWKRRLVG